VFTRLGGTGETGLAGPGGPAGLASTIGPTGGQTDAARAGDLMSPARAGPLWCEGHGEGMACPVVSQMLLDQTLPAPLEV
jgi:hypothetical protein